MCLAHIYIQLTVIENTDWTNLEVKFDSLDMMGKVRQRELGLKPAWIYNPDIDRDIDTL